MESRLPLDAVGPDEARDLLQQCCGSERWVDRMIARRPFGSRDALLAAAREEWFALSEADWREAFGHHPMIGDRDALRAQFTTTRHLSQKEQAGVGSAAPDTLDALAEVNRAYFAKFGYIFIVCATGLSAGDMLAMLRSRLGHDPTVEIRVAADEQARITELRLRDST